MESTKEKILREALGLFAQKGYGAVSVRDIAGQLGMTQSALYKHYASKRDIFDCIVARMTERDAQRAEEYAVPAESISDDAQAYKSTDMGELKSFTLAQFDYWTAEEFAAAFRKMLTLEQYSSEEMQQLYQQYLSGGVLEYVADLFSQVPALEGMDALLLAAELYGPVFLLMSVYDGAKEKEPVRAQAKEHIDRFFGRYGL